MITAVFYDKFIASFILIIFGTLSFPVCDARTRIRVPAQFTPIEVAGKRATARAPEVLFSTRLSQQLSASSILQTSRLREEVIAPVRNYQIRRLRQQRFVRSTWVIGAAALWDPSVPSNFGETGDQVYLVAEWLACWTQAQKGPGSNRSHNAVG